MRILKSAKTVKVGITLGDPAGIGPEIIVKALNLFPVNKRISFTIIGDSMVVNKQKVKLSRRDVEFIDLKNQYSPLASIQYLDKAIELIKANRIHCLVTAPITKAALHLAGFNWPGHTEYLAHKMAVKKILMMFVHPKLRVSLVTRHIALKDIPKKITRANISQAILLTYNCLKSYFKIKNPKIAVCGLNPHAGEGGFLGQEEKSIISPVINALKEKIKYLSGPYPADNIFLKNTSEAFDAVVCMYHDQGLIPLKLLGIQDAVNLTYGLGFVRTSPAHGTALDIAGKNIANPSSLISAINLAVQLTLTR